MKVSKSAVAYGIIAIFAIVVIYTAIYFTLLNSYASISMQLSVTNTTNVYPYNSSYLRLNITNTGSKLVKGLLLNIYVNGVSKKLYTISIPVKKTAELNFTYIYSSPGNYSFSAIANPGDILNLSKSSITKASQNVTVLEPQSPLIIDYLPKLSGGYTKTVALNGYGVSVVPELFSQYNLGEAASVFQSRTSAIKNILAYFGGIDSFEGGYTANNSIMVGQAWLQGTSPAALSSTMQGLGFSIDNTSSTVKYLSEGEISACIYFQNGWTKMVYTVSNATVSCIKYYSTTPNSSISGNIINEINSSRYLQNATSAFTYTNTSAVGGMLFKNSTTLSLGNIFASNYGIFLSMLSKTHNSKNSSYVCNGILNDNNTVCTIYGIAQNSSFRNFSLVDSEMLTRNYTASIYSIVPVSETSSAYYSGISLIKHLNISEIPYEWSSAFADSCGLYNTSIGCKVANGTVDSASLNFTNEFNSTINLNSLSCYLAVPSAPNIVNRVLRPGKSTAYNVSCTYGSLSSFGVVSNYTLELNYTIGGVTKTASGYLKLSGLS